MSKQQPLANTNSAKSEYQRDAVDNLSPLSVERRTLLLGAAAVAAGALSDSGVGRGSGSAISPGP